MKVYGFAISLALTALGAYTSWRGTLGAGFARQQSVSTEDPKLQALQELGGIYAKQAKLSLVKVEMTILGKVANDSTAWAKQLKEALAVGYAPGEGRFVSVAFADVKPFMKVRMVSGRSPEETVGQVLIPGNVIAQTTWHFAGIDPVKSYALFSPQGELLFDTLLSMPLVRGRLFWTGH